MKSRWGEYKCLLSAAIISISSSLCFIFFLVPQFWHLTSKLYSCCIFFLQKNLQSEMCDWALGRRRHSQWDVPKLSQQEPASPEYPGGILSCITESSCHRWHLYMFIICTYCLTGLFNATKTFRVSYICLFFYTFVLQTQATVHLCMLLPNCCGRRWITRRCSPVNAFERLGYIYMSHRALCWTQR